MAKPPEAAMAGQTGNAGLASTLQNFSVRNTVLPFDVQEALKTAEVETVELLLLTGIGCPGLAAV